jgi:indolepyruvate ferredoxin oxidoreductase, alpha subunit
MNVPNGQTEKPNKLLQFGNEAIAHGAREAGCYFGVAYPGTPSTEILELFHKFPGVFAKWSPNEKVAVEVGIGACLTGTRVLCTMKHVGVNVAMDPLMTFTYTGVVGGFVLIAADDPAMHSSQNEQDSRLLAKFMKVPVFDPANSQEAHDFTKMAFDFSEKYNVFVMMRETTRIAHAKGLVQLDEWADPVRGDNMKRDVERFVMMPNYARPRHTFAEKRSLDLLEFSNNWEGNQLELKSKKVGIITAGVASNYVRELMPDASILKVGMPWPFPAEKARKLAEHCDRVLVIEELEPFMEEEAKIAGINVQGKDFFPREGELDLDTVGEGLHKAGLLDAVPVQPAGEPVVARPPVLCAGCPHRGIYMALRKMNADVYGDIGCYTLAALPPLETLHTCFCMGASIGNAVGASLAESKHKHHTVAVIGDSTFFHSGLTGLLDAVASNANITVVIVDNSITAMTGGQQHPGSGSNLIDDVNIKIPIEQVVKGLGVQHMIVADTYDYNATLDQLKSALNHEGPSVLIARNPCALFPAKRGVDPYTVVEDDCTGCGNCLRIGCPAISNSGKKTDRGLAIARIDPAACTGCTLCQQVCKDDAILELANLQTTRGEEVEA